MARNYTTVPSNSCYEEKVDVAQNPSWARSTLAAGRGTNYRLCPIHGASPGAVGNVEFNHYI